MENHLQTTHERDRLPIMDKPNGHVLHVYNISFTTHVYNINPPRDYLKR